MKDKDILKIIKKDLEDNTPNIIDKISLQDIQIKDESVIVKRERKHRIFNFKILVPVTSFVFIGLLLIGFLYKKPIVVINEGIKVTNKDKIVANYTTQALDLIDFNQYALLTAKSNSNKYISDFDENSILIQEYLNLIERNIKISQTTNNKHPYKMEVETTDFFGTILKYTLEYYEEREEDDDETEKKMTGIIIYEGLIFDFVVDQEIDSEESEIEISITNKTGFSMSIEKEIESNEYSIEYSINYSNTNHKKVSLEIKEDEIELKVESNNLKQQFEIYSITNLHYEIKIEATIFELVIDINNKEFNYIIKK